LGQSVKYWGYSSLLRQARWVSPYFEGEKVFRGTTLDDLDNYKEGKVYYWPFFISTSANESIAQKFGPVLFIIEIPYSSPFSALDIRSYSIYPKEEEILFHPYTRFKVLKKERNTVTVTVY